MLDDYGFTEKHDNFLLNEGGRLTADKVKRLERENMHLRMTNKGQHKKINDLRKLLKKMYMESDGPPK